MCECVCAKNVNMPLCACVSMCKCVNVPMVEDVNVENVYICVCAHV